MIGVFKAFMKSKLCNKLITYLLLVVCAYLHMGSTLCKISHMYNALNNGKKYDIDIVMMAGYVVCFLQVLGQFLQR
jgi:hypothetical protein